MAVKHFNKQTFDQAVIADNTICLVDFWASWCGPCKMLSPMIDALAEELGETVIVGKVNVDEEHELAAKYGVMSIPTVIAFKDGEEIGREVGLKTKDQITALLG